MKIRLLIAAGALLLLPCAWFIAGKLHRFAYWIDRKSDADVEALATSGWRIDRLEVAPDVELVGLVRPPKRADARWLLFVPGNSESLLGGFRDVLDGLRGEDDVGLAFWAYRGFENSGGIPTPAHLRADLGPQWQRLLDLGASPDRIEVWGYSLGSMLAPHLVAELCAAKTPPRRLVLLATAPQFGLMPHGTFGRFRRSDRFETLSAIDGVTCDVDIAHGSIDPALPIAGAREVAARFGERASFHELPGCGHADLWQAAREQLWRSK